MCMTETATLVLTAGGGGPRSPQTFFKIFQVFVFWTFLSFTWLLVFKRENTHCHTGWNLFWIDHKYAKLNHAPANTPQTFLSMLLLQGMRWMKYLEYFHIRGGGCVINQVLISNTRQCNIYGLNKITNLDTRKNTACWHREWKQS